MLTKTMPLIFTSTLYHDSGVRQHPQITQVVGENIVSSLDPLPNTTLPLTDCLVLEYSKFVPWDNPDNIVSSEVEGIVRQLKDLLFLPVMFLIGCPANIVNMVIFYKQGLKERINVCLFALSLADELYLINNMLWFGEQLGIQFTTKEMFGPVMKFMSKYYLFGFHGFVCVSQILSAIIACERCFCVLHPLRSQTVLRASTMTVIIITVTVAVLAVSFVIMTRYFVTCGYNPMTNTYMSIMIPGEFYLRHQELIIYLDVFMFGAGLPGLVMLVVAAATIITLKKLHEAAVWRAETSSSAGMSPQEIALTKMLVSNSGFFIACVFPFTAFRLIFLFMPEVNTGRRHHNFYMMMQWILVIISFFNSTFNFVVYYTMGSRYRQVFWQLFSSSRSNLSGGKA